MVDCLGLWHRGRMRFRLPEISSTPEMIELRLTKFRDFQFGPFRLR